MAQSEKVVSSPAARRRTVARLLLVFLGIFVLAVQPAAAQSVGTAFCTSQLADTIRNVFTVIQLGGPLIGGVLALGAMVLIPTVRQADRKHELKVIRNQGILWGVMVAPLGTFILQFLLNNVVVGGSGCAF